MSLRSSKMSHELESVLPPKKHLFYTNGLMLLIGSLLVMTAWNISGRPWFGLGFDLPVVHAYALIGIFLIILLYSIDLIHGWINKKEMMKKIQDLSYIVPTNWEEYKHFIFLAFSAGICEEIIFRGFLVSYLVEQLKDLSGGYILAIIIPAIAFSVSHIYQGWWSVLKIFCISTLLGVIFYYSGSLLWVVILHVAIDLISGLLSIHSFLKSDE